MGLIHWEAVRRYVQGYYKIDVVQAEAPRKPVSLILHAAQFATEAHQGRIRKYTGRPYIEHPMRVAGRACLIPDVSERMVAAAWLHDVLEDHPEFGQRMRDQFRQDTVYMVELLTNKSKQKQYTMLPRSKRKAIDREHLAQCPWEVKVIKFLDRIDNVNDLAACEDREYVAMYFDESRLLGEAMWYDQPTMNALHEELLRAIQ